MTLDQARAHIRDVAARVVPPEAEATMLNPPEEEATLVSWSYRLSHHAEQPNKLAIPIRLKVSARLTQMFMAGDKEFLQRADRALQKAVAQHMRSYEPERELPPGLTAKPFEIHVDVPDLFPRGQ